MTEETGRKALQYLVRCALPLGDSLEKQDQNGSVFTFPGQLGLAPEYKNGACDGACQQLLTACVLAHVNTARVSVPLWLVSKFQRVGWDTSAGYPLEEASFFGNLWSGSDATFYCASPALAPTDEVPGRLVVPARGPAPYQDAEAVQVGTCAACSRSNSAGLDTCAVGGKVFGNLITTWKSRTYVAESASLGGNAAVITCQNCQSRVGYLLPGATVTFDEVSAVRSGVNDLVVYYTNGDPLSTERTLGVSINGGTAIAQTFPGENDWNTPRPVDLPADGFIAGSANTVAFSVPSGGSGPDLVWIEVVPADSN